MSYNVYPNPLETSIGRKNYIINGNFDIWQRGTSQTSAGYGSDDRWVNYHIGSTKTHSQQAFTLGQTNVPNEPKYFSRTIVTSVAGSGNYCDKSQPIESVRTLAGKTATLSFYAKADASKNMAVAFSQYFGTGGSPSTAIHNIGVTTCALTTVWQKFTITVNLPSIAGKTLGTNNNDSLQVVFYFDAGSNYNAQTNSLGQQSGTFDIAQVQLEEGSVATNFEYRPIGEELALCQRYYERMNASSLYQKFGVGCAQTTTQAQVTCVITTKRGIPTFTYSALTDFRTLDSTGAAIAPTGMTGIGDISSIDISLVVAAGYAIGIGTMLQANNTLNAWIGLDAEL